MILALKQTYRSTEQNRENKNKLMHIQSMIGKGKKKYILGNDCHSISDAGKTKYPHEKECN